MTVSSSLEPRPATTDRSDGREYLAGNYRPVEREIVAHELKCEGEIPRDLAGTFVRTGSNPRYEPTGRYHWFDGDGMLHAVHLEDGKASYRNRWVRTKGFLEEQSEGRSLWKGLLHGPDFERSAPFKNTSNTDLVYHSGKLLSLWWLGGEPYCVKLPELETKGVETYGGKLTSGISAHPKVDPVSGEMVFIDYAPLPPYLTYGVISRDGELVHSAQIDLPGPRLQHDIAITQNYTILMDLPLYSDPELLLQGRAKTRYFRDKPSRFGLISRRGTSETVRWFEASPCYMYHTINAWEEGDKVVMVGCKIEEPLVRDPLNKPSDKAAPVIGFLRLAPKLYRWTFDLTTGATKEETLDDLWAEFPRMNNAMLGQKTRYGYSQRLADAPTLLFDAVVKYDTDTGAGAAHEYPKGCFGGETAFAPRVGSKSEDDGYLVTFVANENTGHSELYIIDAQHMDRAPVARVQIPQRVPTGYHSWWVSAEDLAGQRA